MNGWAIQAVGAAALVAGIASVQFKSRKGILLAQLLANALWFIHFGLLGALTGALLNAIGALRAYLFFRWRSSKWSRAVFWVVLGTVFIAGIMTWGTPVSLLAVIGIVLSTIALWQDNEQHIRWLLLIGSPIWFIYDFLVGSYVGSINELIFSASIIVALIRYQRVNRRVDGTV